MASKMKRYDELSQEDRDMVDSAINSMKESSSRTAQLREENQINRDALMRKGRDYTETPGDQADFGAEPYKPENGGRFEHPILRRKK